MKSSRVFARLGLIGCVLLAGCGRPPESSEPKTTTGAAPATPSQTPTPAPSAEAPASASSAEAPPPEAPSPFAGPATQRNPVDLAWLTELVRVLADEPATREQVGAYLGKDAGPDMQHPNGRLIRGHSPYFEKASVYPLPHLKIEVAVDISLAANSRPNRSAIGSVLSPLEAMPRAPDDFSSGPKLAHYRKGKHGTARVFVELDPKNQNEVRSIHVDVDGVGQ